MHCLHCTCSMFAWLPSSSPPSFPHPFLDDYCCSRHHCLPPHNIGSEPSKSKSKTKWRLVKDEGELCRLFEDWWFLPLSMMIPSGRKGLRGGRVKRWIDFLWIVRCAAIFSSTCGYSHFTWREAKLLNTNLDKSLKLSSSIKKSASRCKTFRYLARRKKVKKDFLPFREIT